MSVPGRVNKVFDKNKGALSAEQSPLAFNG